MIFMAVKTSFPQLQTSHFIWEEKEKKYIYCFYPVHIELQLDKKSSLWKLTMLTTMNI